MTFLLNLKNIQILFRKSSYKPQTINSYLATTLGLHSQFDTCLLFPPPPYP